ncbi:MAG TPA: sortase [Thermomicrobiaceae bacterium]|nr:sortase [Thermomicrobiaceae bacterium]
MFLGAALIISAGASAGPPPADVSSSQASAETLVRKPTRSLWPPLLRAKAVPHSVTPVEPAVTPSERPAPGAPAGLQGVSPRTSTPTPKLALPPATEIAIPAAGIDTHIVEVAPEVVTIDGQSVIQGQVADFAAGHDAVSANPGEGGNIVIAGHDDWKGEVFKNLHTVNLGDQVVLTAPGATHRYTITEIHYRQEVGVPLAERLATGQFLAPMPEERVTLVTCWPYGVDSHRLIVVAKPA